MLPDPHHHATSITYYSAFGGRTGFGNQGGFGSRNGLTGSAFGGSTGFNGGSGTDQGQQNE